MSITAKIFLKSKKDQSLLRFHPWVFSGAIKSIDGEPQEGDLVAVHANKGRFLGVGHYSSGSIAVRILSFNEEEEIDASFWEKRIHNAFNLRKSLGLINNSETNLYRLIHAEGDLIPGLVVDMYNNHMVMQCNSQGMLQQTEMLTDMLLKHFPKVESVYLKTKDKSEENRHIKGEADDTVALEYGIKYRVNWVTGQKTGFFIDQRENRFQLGQHAKGKRVLNTYSYSGGFSLAAIKGGAELVHSVDASQGAIDLLEDNIQLNGFGDKNHQSHKADVLEYLKDSEEKYDIIVLDPPAFAKHMSARHNAIQGYKRINMKAIEMLPKGGLLYTFSCSQVVDKYMFNNTITAAAIQSGRNIKIVGQLHQPADHPVNIFHPESEYLKGLILQVD